MARFGFARAAFDGNVYHSLDPASVYLILEKGTAIVMDGEFEVDGWVWATALVGVEWGSGWMPRNYWCASCSPKISLSDFWPDLGLQLCGFIGHTKPMACTCTAAKVIGDSFLESIIASRSIYYPTLRADIVEYGMPAYIRRRPIWTCWELRVYVHIPSEGSALNRAGFCDEWIYWEGHRLSRLAQLVEVYYRIDNLYTGGVYDSLQLRLEEWEWDYEENDWFRVDHI